MRSSPVEGGGDRLTDLLEAAALAGAERCKRPSQSLVLVVTQQRRLDRLDDIRPRRQLAKLHGEILAVPAEYSGASHPWNDITPAGRAKSLPRCGRSPRTTAVQGGCADR